MKEQEHKLLSMEDSLKEASETKECLIQQLAQANKTVTELESKEIAGQGLATDIEARYQAYLQEKDQKLADLGTCLHELTESRNRLEQHLEEEKIKVDQLASDLKLEKVSSFFVSFDRCC